MPQLPASRTRATAGTLEVIERIHRIGERTADSTHVHSLLLAVESDDGEISTRTAAGSATTRDPYYVASIAKMFTASVVMQLIDERVLATDDRLVDLVPDLDLDGIHRYRNVDHTPEVRLHHLLHQTSGLPDYFAGGVADDLAQGRDRSYTVGEVVEIARSTPASFPPGDRGGRRSAYSDTNYQLLTAIVEAATGSSYAEAVDTRIAEPLGLEDTYVVDMGAPAPARQPLALHNKDRVLEIPCALASEQGAGGIVSTLEDQVRFSRAYHHGELFDDARVAQMRRWNRVFFPVDYGYGLMRYRLPRLMTPLRPSPELIGHSGVTNSFTFYAPELRCHIVGTLNQFDNPGRAFRLMSKVTSLLRGHAWIDAGRDIAESAPGVRSASLTPNRSLPATRARGLRCR